MTSSMERSQKGFTLIEIMVVLVLTAIALLSLGAFSLSVMDSGSQSRERLTAVHLAEQVIEEWQHNANDYYPIIGSDCGMTAGSATLTAASTSACAPLAGGITYTITANVAAAKAPRTSDLSNFTGMTAMGFTNTPMVKLVTVSWSHKGTTKSIYLTHLTR